MSLAPTALDACKQKEAIVIATEWKEFREIDWQTVYNDMTKPAFVFDGRLLVDADKLRQIGFQVGSFIPASKYAPLTGLQVKVIGRGDRT